MDSKLEMGSISNSTFMKPNKSTRYLWLTGKSTRPLGQLYF